MKIYVTNTYTCNLALESISAGFIHLGRKQAILKVPLSPHKYPRTSQKCKHTKQMNPEGRHGVGEEKIGR